MVYNDSDICIRKQAYFVISPGDPYISGLGYNMSGSSRYRRLTKSMGQSLDVGDMLHAVQVKSSGENAAVTVTNKRLTRSWSEKHYLQRQS